MNSQPVNFRAAHLAALLACLIVAGAGSLRASEPDVLTSPDGRIEVSIAMSANQAGARSHWSASFRGKPILSNCGLGLETVDAGDLLAGARVVQLSRRAVDERIPVLFGKADHAEDRFAEIRYTVESARRRRTDVVFRCYNDAIAVRYDCRPRNKTPSLRSPRKQPPSAWRATQRPTRNISRIIAPLTSTT